MEKWTGAAKGSLPDTVKHFAILWNPKQFVVGGDVMEVGTLLIGKEQVWFPNGVQHRWVQVQGIIRILAICQPWVIPLLSQKNVHSVILQKCHARGLRISPILAYEVHLRFPFTIPWFDGVWVNQSVCTSVKNEPLSSIRGRNRGEEKKEDSTKPGWLGWIFMFKRFILGGNNTNWSRFCYRKVMMSTEVSLWWQIVK